MPTFDNIEITTSVDFEVYCSCGEGICNNASTRSSRNRCYPQVVVEPCQKCIEAATSPLHDEIHELKAEIERLQNP